MATILELVQAACYEGNINAPASLLSTDLQTLQLKHLTYATARELRAARVWPQLKRVHQFTLESGRTSYRLPVDFYATIPGTEYAQSHSEPMRPLTDPEWNMRLYGHGRSCIGREFRIFGPDAADVGQFHVSPTPGTSDAGSVLSYEYITVNWLQPAVPPPQPLQYVIGAPIHYGQLVASNGNLYFANNPSGTMGPVPPSVDANGVGQEGGVRWKSITMNYWEPVTAYAVGDTVQNGSYFYVATTAGTSAPSVGPTGGVGNVGIVDGTVVWTGISILTWTTNTQYSAGQYAAAGNYYRAVSSGTSSSHAPNWGPTGATWMQGNVGSTWQWIYQGQYPALYPTILADTDVPQFDDELMIGGLKWRFLRARGLEYRDLQQEYEAHKDAAVSRLTPMMKISLAGESCWRCYPRVPDGSWST